MMLASIPTINKPVNDRFEQAIQHIQDSWKEGRSLQEICSRFKVDPGNLDRKFRKKVGVTAKLFVDQKRKDYVLAQIRRNQKFGYEIGAELGFADDLAFYRWVKRAFGVPFKKLQQVAGSGQMMKQGSPLVVR